MARIRESNVTRDLCATTSSPNPSRLYTRQMDSRKSVAHKRVRQRKVIQDGSVPWSDEHVGNEESIRQPWFDDRWD